MPVDVARVEVYGYTGTTPPPRAGSSRSRRWSDRSPLPPPTPDAPPGMRRRPPGAPVAGRHGHDRRVADAQTHSSRRRCRRRPSPERADAAAAAGARPSARRCGRPGRFGASTWRSRSVRAAVRARRAGRRAASDARCPMRRPIVKADLTSPTRFGSNGSRPAVSSASCSTPLAPELSPLDNAVARAGIVGGRRRPPAGSDALQRLPRDCARSAGRAAAPTARRRRSRDTGASDADQPRADRHADLLPIP